MIKLERVEKKYRVASCKVKMKLKLKQKEEKGRKNEPLNSILGLLAQGNQDPARSPARANGNVRREKG